MISIENFGGRDQNLKTTTACFMINKIPIVKKRRIGYFFSSKNNMDIAWYNKNNVL